MGRSLTDAERARPETARGVLLLLLLPVLLTAAELLWPAMLL